MSPEELQAAVKDLSQWWDLGVFATAEARKLQHVISTHLSPVAIPNPDEETLKDFQPELLGYLTKMAAEGPTPEIQALAIQLLDARTEHMNHEAMIFIIDEECESPYPGFSYAWISGKKYFEETGYLEDWYRTDTVRAKYPTFKGGDDMESHFEFKMTVAEVRAHLLALGLEERTFPQNREG